MNFKRTPEEARELVAIALESGDYDQGQEMLHCTVDNTYCCLGVATCIYMNNEDHDINIETSPVYSYTCYDGVSDYLLGEVREWLGFATVDAVYKTSSLPDDNDTEGLSFKQIAKLFREPPPGLLDVEPSLRSRVYWRLKRWFA